MKFTTLALACPALLAFASCVAQERYDDATLSAKHYQNKTIENDRRVSELEDENRRLRAQLDASEKSLKEAGFSPEAVDERLANLSKILAEIGGNPGDVTKFSVDGGYVYRMKDSIVFGLGSAELSEDGKKILAEICTDISSRAHGKVYVRGHTDSTPISKPETKAKYPNGNLQLSAERAVSVGAYLGGAGKIEEAKIVVMGFGSHDPVASNDSPENKQRNRRVDIFVADAEAGAQK
ncbi:MAG: OmpA family protein [Planctomycetaceae bacterium]|nr:OmpA family protein [Planctomycetaceae bacterium]